jgi:hypothetical protein
VKVYAKDLAGNIGTSQRICFEVNAPIPALFVTAVTLTIVAVIAVNLLVYWKKRKHQG